MTLHAPVPDARQLRKSPKCKLAGEALGAAALIAFGTTDAVARDSVPGTGVDDDAVDIGAVLIVNGHALECRRSAGVRSSFSNQPVQGGVSLRHARIFREREWQTTIKG